MKVVLCVWIEPYIENDLSFCVWPVHTPTTSKEVLTLSASTSPLPYTGNKSCIVNTILSVMPKHTVYIDPCMGSAEVFFRKPRAEKEILNDYNGDLVNLFRVIQNNEKLAYLLGRLYLSINGELAFKQNKDRLKGVPNILDDVIETSQIFYDASWEDIQNAAAFLENQVYSFSSTGQTFGIARRDMSQRLPRLMSAYNRIRDAIILHRDYKDVITYAACPGSFILLDPPYKGTEDMYSKANFDIEQHDILFSFMSEVNQQHHGEVKFLITYNNDPYIRGVAEKHIQNVSVEDVGSFENLEDAYAAGYRLCRHCSPIAKLYRKESDVLQGYCQSHAASVFFKDRFIGISTPISDWRIIPSGKGNEVVLYHKNTLGDKKTGPVPRYHLQWVSQNTISGYLEYISDHDLYRNMHPLYPVQSKKNSPPPMKGTKRYRKEQKRAAKKARRQSIAHVLTLIENLDTQARVARSM